MVAVLKQTGSTTAVELTFSLTARGDLPDQKEGKISDREDMRSLYPGLRKHVCIVLGILLPAERHIILGFLLARPFSVTGPKFKFKFGSDQI